MNRVRAGATARQEELAAAFARIDALCREQNLAIPEVAAFHRIAFPATSRVGFFVATGARVVDLFAALTRADLRDFDLRISIVEVPCDGLLYSVALFGAVESAAIGTEQWVERVAFPVFVTPATAALGKDEVELIAALTAQDRRLAVVIAGINEAPTEERAALILEIETHKLEPLRAQLGGFPVFFDSSPATIAALRLWIDEHIEEAKTRQIQLVANAWLDEIEETVAAGVASDEGSEARLARVSAHLAEHTASLAESASHESLVTINHLHAQFDALQEASATAASRFGESMAGAEKLWGQAFDPLRQAWHTFETATLEAPREVVRRVDARVRDACTDFSRAYEDVVGSISLESIADPSPTLDYGNDNNDVARRIDQTAREFASRYIFGPFRQASSSANVVRELRTALLSIVSGDARSRFDRAVAAVRAGMPALADEVQRVTSAFEREVTMRVDAARRACRWQRVQTDVSQLRDEWTRFAEER